MNHRLRWAWSAIAGIVTAQLFANCGSSSEGGSAISGEAGVSSVSSGAGGEGATAGADSGGGASGVAGASGGGGGGGAVAPPCIDEQLTPPEETCRLLGPRAMDACPAGTTDDWEGCYNATCAVCSKSVVDYPYYFDWHPCCRANETCSSNDPIRCHALCPKPTEREKHPPCFRVGPEP